MLFIVISLQTYSIVYHACSRGTEVWSRCICVGLSCMQRWSLYVSKKLTEFVSKLMAIFHKGQVMDSCWLVGDCFIVKLSWAHKIVLIWTQLHIHWCVVVRHILGLCICLAFYQWFPDGDMFIFLLCQFHNTIVFLDINLEFWMKPIKSEPYGRWCVFSTEDTKYIVLQSLSITTQEIVLQGTHQLEFTFNENTRSSTLCGGLIVSMAHWLVVVESMDEDHLLFLPSSCLLWTITAP